MERYWGRALREGRAPFLFAPAEGTRFLAPFGWREVAFRSSSDEARRFRREMRGAWLWRLLAGLAPADKREAFRRMSGFALLGRAGTEGQGGPSR
jgi:hypothetical protein